jgi:hypothetical protein
MNMQDSKSSGRRRGPRRRRHQDNGHYNHPSSEQRQQSAPEQKPTFLQKIMGFFGFGPKKKTYPAYEAGPKPAKQAGPASNSNRYEKADSSSRNTPRSEPRAEAAQHRPVRKPEAVEVNSPKLYVGNLSFDATESDLTELFNGVGAVRSVEIVTYRDTEKSKGFGFIMMTAIDEAKRAVTELHDKEFMGRRLVVSGAKTNDRAA